MPGTTQKEGKQSQSQEAVPIPVNVSDTIPTAKEEAKQTRNQQKAGRQQGEEPDGMQILQEVWRQRLHARTA